MLHAYILIESHPGNAAIVAAQVQKIPGVLETEVVTGPYDVVARVRAEDMDELARWVSLPIQALPGVMRTAICIIGERSFSPSRVRGLRQPSSHLGMLWKRHHRWGANGSLAKKRRRRVKGPLRPV